MPGERMPVGRGRGVDQCLRHHHVLAPLAGRTASVDGSGQTWKNVSRSRERVRAKPGALLYASRDQEPMSTWDGVAAVLRTVSSDLPGELDVMGVGAAGLQAFSNILLNNGCGGGPGATTVFTAKRFTRFNQLSR